MGSSRKGYCSVLIGVLAFAPTISHSQTTTTCSRYGSVVNCTTTPAPSTPAPAPLNYGAILEQGQRLVPDYQEQQRQQLQNRRQRAEIEQMQQQQSTFQTRVRVGNLVREGKCGDALDAALSAGELELARQVKALCP